MRASGIQILQIWLCQIATFFRLRTERNKMMLFPTLILTSLGRADNRSALLNLVTPGLSVRNVLQEVSKQTGHEYRAQSELADDVVVVRLSNAIPEDFTARLAEVVGGEWRETNGSFLLRPSLEYAREERQEVIASQKRGLERALKQVSGQLAKHPVFDQSGAESMLKRVDKTFTERHAVNGEFGLTDALNRERDLPINRLLARMLQTAPPNLIVGMDPHTRVVYSPNPNPLQRELPSACQSLVSKFIDEEKIWEAAQRSVRTRSGTDLDISGLPPKFKVDFAVDNTSVPYAEVEVVDEVGKVWLEASTSLEDWDQSAADAYRVPPKALPGETRVEEGIQAAEMRSLLERNTQNPLPEATRKALVTKWNAVLNDPARFEPMSIVPGALWSALAEQRSQNLVASVGEEDYQRVPDFAEGGRTPSTILSRLSFRHVIKDADGWLTIRPKLILQDRSEHIDRAAAGEVIRQTVAAGGIPIEAAASYMAKHLQGFPFLSWDAGYLQALEPTTATRAALDDMLLRDEFRLYGLLDPLQRDLLRRRPIRVAELPSAARNFLYRLFYVEGWGADNGRREATDAFPNGVPQNAQLQIVEEHSGVLAEPIVEDDGLFRVYPLELYAAELGPALLNANASSWKRFRVLKRRTVDFRLDLAPGMSRRFSLSETFDSGDDPVPYDQLPASYRSEADKAKKSAAVKPTPKVVPPP